MKKEIIGIAITLVIALAFVFSANFNIEANVDNEGKEIPQVKTTTHQLADPPVGMSYKLESHVEKTEKQTFY